MLHLPPVVCLVALCNRPYNCGVISKLHYNVGGVTGGEIARKEGVEKRAKDTPLRSPCIQNQGGEVWFPILMWWGLLFGKSKIQVHSELPGPGLLSFCTSLWGIIVLNAELKSTNSILTYVSLWSRCARTVWGDVIIASSVDLFVR